MKKGHKKPAERPYYDHLFRSMEGCASINGRGIIGAMISKHLEGFTNRRTITHIRQNTFMQYFFGYSSFTNEVPFTAPLFVEIHKRMTLELITENFFIYVKYLFIKTP